MYAFLRNYRATIHPSTKQPPCVSFYGREINIKIPSLPMKTKAQNNHAKAKICDKKAEKKMKDYADNRRNARPSKLQTGDTALVQQDKTNKFTTPFDPRPYEIIKKKGSMVTTKREVREITRNSSHFKSVLYPPELPGTDGIISLSLSANSQFSQSFLSRVLYVSIFSLVSCFACLNLYILNSGHFFRRKVAI